VEGSLLKYQSRAGEALFKALRFALLAMTDLKDEERNEEELKDEEPGDEGHPGDPTSQGFWGPSSVGDPRYASWPAPPVVDEVEQATLIWRIRGLIRTIRPHQWVKNVFVLAPVVFATKLFDPLLLTNAAVAFFAFCLLAGAVYTINDLADVEADRLHPVKRHRPIASGRVPDGVARAFAYVLVAVSLGAGYLISPAFALVAACYFLLNVAYTMKLKHVAYLDVGCISAGFVLRVLGGGYATRIEVSAYLFVCTALLALFLGFGKRRHELTTASARAGKQRVALEGYTKRGLDLALSITAVLTVGTYLKYTVDDSTIAFFRSSSLWPTTIFVVLGVMRFLHIVRYRPKAESPTQEMLSDGPMVGIVLLWIVVVGYLVYHLQPS
jgi:decaprenyl-phosphate phosphoribosyltransferase